MRRAISAAAVALLATLLVASDLPAEEPAIATARQILGEADRDPSAIERARDHLERAVAGGGAESAAPAIVIELSRLWYLHGELRAEDDETRLAAFDRGRALGETAVRRAPQDPYAHLWYAINLGRWAEESGILSAALELRRVKHEVAKTLRLAPDLPDAHVFAGGLARHLPGFMGGDPTRAEEHFRRAVALDPRRTRFHLELAELLIETDRIDEARTELRRVLDETEPSDRLFTTLHDRPRAKRRLAEIGDGAR